MTAVAQPQERVAQLETSSDAPLHIALVEPQIPPNTGNIARLCAATGCALHLVQPLGFSIEDRELKRAGLDYWHEVCVIVHASLSAFLDATDAKRRWFFSVHATRIYTDADFALGDVLVFGKETTGLPPELVAANLERCLKIPIRPGSVRSVNLSTAAGIAAYAALARVGFPGLA
jgi:tRNA (cytidine/uridine-2'-O-)-methyltransferase